MSGTTELIGQNGSSAPSDGISVDPAISADGKYMVFISDATNLVPGDTKFPSPGQCPDIFVRDRDTGATSRVSLTFSGGEANNASCRAVISSYGNALAYLSLATNLGAGDTTSTSCIPFTFRINRCQHILARFTL